MLSEVSTLLAASLDYATTLRRVAELAVPLLADHCIIDLVGEDLDRGPIAVAHVNPERARRLDEVVRRHRPPPGAPRHGMPDGRLPPPQLFENVPDALLVRMARDPEHLAALRELGPRSVIVVPLVAHDRPLGGLMLVMAESGRRYGPADLAVAEDLARRAALAVDNARLYRQANEALRVRDDVLAFVSHDLKAPLASMRLHVEMLQDHPLADTRLDGDPVSPRERLARIEALTIKMSRLIGTLVDAARSSVDQDVQLQLRPTDLVALANQAIAEQQYLTDCHTLRLAATTPELIGDWDADRLGRVLDNLLDNAVKYTPEGGVITVEVSSVEDVGGAWAVLRVADQGVGIPPEDLPHVFGRFYRARNVVGRIAGTGVGLAAVRHTVERHGGTIEVNSHEGRGTTFTIRLPLVSSVGTFVSPDRASRL